MGTDEAGTGPRSVSRLVIWQEGMGLVEAVYTESACWPAAEKYGLTSQVRRAAVSIPANISEGVGRGSRGEIVRFCQLALGSAYEVHTLLHLALRLRYSQPESLKTPLESLESLIRRISAYIRYQEQKPAAPKSSPSPT